MAKGKKFIAANKQVDRTNLYDASEAIALLKKVSFEKFDASVEFAVRLNLDPRKAEQNLRGAIVLPHGTGKTKRVVVFAKGDKAKEALAAGADFVGDEDLVKKVLQGWMDFDTVVATPDMMAQVGKLGRTLGPKGLMPNPKFGTVTNDIKTSVKAIKNGQIEIKNDKDVNIAVSIGKKSFSDAKLKENYDAFMNTLLKEKPTGIKGNFILSAYLTSTMGVSYQLKL